MEKRIKHNRLIWKFNTRTYGGSGGHAQRRDGKTEKTQEIKKQETVTGLG